MKQTFVAILFISITVLVACKKDSYITDINAVVSITADTLHFDTVFTTLGSVTQSFKIINNNSRQLKISSISLQSGAGSAYKINADGTPGPSIENITIEANDSIYVFVAVTINPNTGNLPFIVSDSIEIGYNGNKRYVQLQAWGQNAVFLRNKKIEGNTTWSNTLPYVILGGLQVDTTAVLTIPKGTKIFLHADAAFLVDGTLIINGEKFDSTRVYFKSDRLDNPYSGFPGSWPGIYFRGQSNNNVLEFAVVQNAYQGIVAELPSINANPKLILNECIVDNCYDAGILGVNSSINARNCLVSNCGAAKDGNGNIALQYGGQYNLIHCTVVAVSNSYVPHTHPVLNANNYLSQNNQVYTTGLNANFTNCVFWGDSLQDGNEIVLDKQGQDAFLAMFNNCLWRQKTVSSLLSSNGNFINVQGDGNDTLLFQSINRNKMLYNFRPANNSPMLNIGSITGLAFDLDGNNRAVGLPDAGCYEKQ